MDPDADHNTPSYWELAKLKFALGLPEHQNNAEMKNKLLAGIVEGDMAPYYISVCTDLGWNMDLALLDKMLAVNKERQAKFDAESDGDSVSDEDDYTSKWQEKLDYYCSLGDKENAQKLATTKSQDKSLSIQSRLYAVFGLFRISYFHGCDIFGMKKAIEKATELIEGGPISGGAGDWSSRNKLKAYEGLYSLAIREYDKSARLLLEAVPTYESYELASFEDIVKYALLACMISLPRHELQNNLSKHGEMAQALKLKCPDHCEYFSSLYECRYADFFVSLALIEKMMRVDPLLHPHYRQYVRDMRLRAYDQLLQAYRTFGLQRMGETFGVTTEFIENEVGRFAADGRLLCKIDRVAKVVITKFYVNDEKSRDNQVFYSPQAVHDREVLYQKIIKHGDHLLNRMKKLARVIDF
ncbi:unnamed protein product [Timema podura]|uniref:26S proteasome non-ATPase regulatory subunit 6 n=3 Tax=Timema TaxID=61471 RepID=A0A7R9EPK4_9NEOP|nr:unnamed protein product [Timema bartmani]CAD7585489.1 unnamed protein product [Timema genevievae]CAG2055021.1 unnamed protein product [Timema podura]